MKTINSRENDFGTRYEYLEFEITSTTTAIKITTKSITTTMEINILKQ